MQHPLSARGKLENRSCSCRSSESDVRRRATTRKGRLTSRLKRADKGCDASRCRDVCKRHRLDPFVPGSRTADMFWGRYVAEQTFGLLDRFWRIRVRYETLVRNFKSMNFSAIASVISRRLS